MALKSFYRTIGHTADVGIEVEAPDKAGIFTRCALAMFDMMFGLESIGQTKRRQLSATSDTMNELLVAWLNEVLYVYSAEGLVFSGFLDVELSEKSISALGVGESFDPRKHTIELEIKAATYHDVSISGDDGKWKARVIFDV